MPTSSKLGFTKQHYTMKPVNHPVNYDPNAVVGNGSMGAKSGVTTSNGSYGGQSGQKS
jgi:hypothetical protein